jgi:hypothetical protein
MVRLDQSLGHQVRRSNLSILLGADVIVTVWVEQTRNFNYPFSGALYDDPTVVYHGTSSINRDLIEAQGLIPGAPRFPVQLLQNLVALCDAVRFRSWSYITVKGLSRGTQLSRPADRRVYLSANFWYARDYATNTGGETVHNAILLADQLLEYLGTNSEHDDLISQVTIIRASLTALTDGSFPVVYAVRVDPEWFDRKGEEFIRLDLGQLVETAVNLSCPCLIPAESLLAKVEYVNGAESGYLGPQPKTWDKARRW